jgi:glycosyltransferase involved in cell wall biosynthesis
LNSIPRRKDIQIIVVDDNSDENKVDFAHFSCLEDKFVDIYFTKEGKGAGYARNVGLDHVKGKWLLFADADDFFHENLSDVFDKYLYSEYDLIYFGMDSVHSDTLKPTDREGSINEDLEYAIKGDTYSQDKIKYQFLYPSCKLLRASLVKDYKIKFDEVPASNDTMFGVKVAVSAKKIVFDTNIIYCITYRKDSLVFAYKYEYLKSRLLVSFELYRYLKAINREQYAQSPVEHWAQIRHCSRLLFIRDFFILLYCYPINRIVKESHEIILREISKILNIL